MSAATLEQRIMAETLARHEKQQAVAGLHKEIGRTKRQLAQRERRLRRLENSLLLSSLEAKPEPINFDRVADKKEIEVAKIVAARLREARILCNHNTGEAAALLGVTSCDLQKIEGAIGVDYIPLWLIKKAAETYCVPIDFLFGVIDDWDAADGEVFLSRNHLAALQRQQLEDFCKTAAEQLKQDNRLKALNSAVAGGVMALGHVVDSINQFRQLNPCTFDDMRGGATVLRKLGIAENLVAHATSVLTHYKSLPESLAAHGKYMNDTFPSHSTE